MRSKIDPNSLTRRNERLKMRNADLEARVAELERTLQTDVMLARIVEVERIVGWWESEFFGDIPNYGTLPAPDPEDILP